MHIIDTVVSRENMNSAWVNVVFLGDGGESVCVRVPCTVPAGSEVGRNHIIKRATALLRSLVSCDAFDSLGERVWSPNNGRFGGPVEPPPPVAPRQTVRIWSPTGED